MARGATLGTCVDALARSPDPSRALSKNRDTMTLLSAGKGLITLANLGRIRGAESIWLFRMAKTAKEVADDVDGKDGRERS